MLIDCLKHKDNFTQIKSSQYHTHAYPKSVEDISITKLDYFMHKYKCGKKHVHILV